MTSYALVLGSLLAPLSLGACSSSRTKDPQEPPGDAAGHHAPTPGASVADLSAKSAALEAEAAEVPAESEPVVDPSRPAVASIPVGGTVLFRNADPTAFIQLSVHGDFASCAPCATVTAFQCLAHGALAGCIQPGGVATLCFHAPGRYPIRVAGGSQTLKGYVDVFRPDAAGAGAR